MWSLERPRHEAGATFEACISRIREPALRERLAAATPAIVNASVAFDDAAQRHALHEIACHSVVAPDIKREDMEKVYTQRMAKRGAPGRRVYDDIFASAPQGRCPLCAKRPVATLDHHLPKALYPALAVAPLNLVPCCSDCNKAKLATAPERAEDAPLHPYFDRLGDDPWLVARVVEERPAAVVFRIEPPAGWDPLLTARVRGHFRRLGLAALYASEAAEELVNVRQQLIEIYRAGGFTAVRAELRHRASSCAAGRPNGWRSATYLAWAESRWFCANGFAAT